MNKTLPALPGSNGEGMRAFPADVNMNLSGAVVRFTDAAESGGSAGPTAATSASSQRAREAS